jgi:hypothetical protein
VAARKNPVVVDDAPEAVTDVLVPGLDDVVAADEAPVDAEATALEEDAVDVARDSRTSRRRRVVAVGVAAVVVASGAIWIAGNLGEPETPGLPQTVSDPAVVLSALDDGGIACNGTVVSGDVATCNATVAVRVFDSEEAADAWVTDLLRDPLTSSAFGWVQHGNAVVSAPLNAAPDVAAALGPAASVR